MLKPVVILLLLISIMDVMASDEIVVRHYQYQERYSFGLQVLELALSKLDKPYRIATPVAQVVNEARGEYQLLSGKLDVQWMTSSQLREEFMLKVDEPIYRGMLGLRLLLVDAESDAGVDHVTSVDELRRFTGGHGKHWADLSVYSFNNLPVKTNSEYDLLFHELIRGRFDYLHRGVNEIWDEVARYPQRLRVSDNIMLYYPNPVYFFVGKHRPELAKQLREGLDRALADGSYQALFNQYTQSYLKRAGVTERQLIVLRNPNHLPSKGGIDTRWWLPKGLSDQVDRQLKRRP